MADLTEMIKGYDFNDVFEQAVDSTTAHVIQKHLDQRPTVQQLLLQLQDALKEQSDELWPDAPMKDAPMFGHLNIDFDLHKGVINVETAAKDHHGRPQYEYIYDTKSDNTVEIAQQPEQTVE